MHFIYFLKRRKFVVTFFLTMIYNNTAKQCGHVSKIIDPVDLPQISGRASRKEESRFCCSLHMVQKTYIRIDVENVCTNICIIEFKYGIL